MNILLFILGAALGSFLNVVALRYDPHAWLFSHKPLRGRSHCPHCGKTLTALELIPLLSFLFQGGHCRYCKKRISLRYPIVEIITGSIVVMVPSFLKLHMLELRFLFSGYGIEIISALWVSAFLILLLGALIDIRFHIIPNEVSVMLAIIGIILMAFTADTFTLTEGSFAGSYAALFGFRGNIWINHGVGALFALILFGMLVVITRGKGMGMGDVKLSMAQGVLFGWPDVLLIIALAFVIGSLIGGVAMGLRKKGFKSLIPFGPFLAGASFLVFCFGRDILSAYFALFPVT